MSTEIERISALSDTRVQQKRHFNSKFIAQAIFVLSIAIGTVEAQDKTRFNIDAGPASTTLNVYADQAGIQLGYSVDTLKGIRTNPIRGDYERGHALRMLLAGTGLVADKAGEGITVRRDTTKELGGSPQSFRQAQNTPPSQSGAGRTADQTSDEDLGHSVDANETASTLEEIVVTGSQIRGTGPVGAGLITLDRRYIDMSGLATTQEVLQTLPQNVGLGANENTSTVGVAPGSFNYGEASSVNLRGLGTASTLSLINGRRSASGGGRGDFVDLNSIPTAAIERVEVLADGASATYGSDAIGGVVNVILRDDYDGARTSIRYAPDTDSIEEIQFGQTFGKSWNTGNFLAIYDLYDRSALAAENRVYTRDSDLSRLGGTNHSRPASNPGNINRYTLADGSQQTVQYAIPSGQDGMGLLPTDLVSGEENLQNIREGSTVLPEQRRHSLFVALTQTVTERTEVFFESRFSTREVASRPQQLVTNNLAVPSSNPFFVDPIGGSTELRINYSFVDDYGTQRISSTVDTFSATSGMAFALGSKWQLEAYGAYNTEKTSSFHDNFPNSALLREALADPDPATAFNPFGDGSHTNPSTLVQIEGFRNFDIQSALSVLNARADGEVFRLPGGAAKLAVGAEVRSEQLESDELSFSTTPEPTSSAANFDLERDVTAAFSELYLPLVTDQNGRPGLRHLILSMAGRYERYSDFGDSFNPKFGLSWSPVDGLSLRSTFGTSFRAPLLVELDDTQRAYQILNVADPASPTGITSTLFIFGNNPTLDSEEGATWTAGVDIAPAGRPDLQFRITYFETEVDRLISLPGNLITLPFQQPDVYSQIIDRNPDPEQMAEFLSNPRCFCGAATPSDIEAVIDFRRQNLAKALLSGVDVSVAYGFDTDVGFFNLSLFGSHLFEFKEQLVKAPIQDNVDTIAKPNSLQLRGSLSWAAAGFTAAIIGDHTGDYTDDRSDPARHVSSWTTWDLRVGYELGAIRGFLEDASIALSVRNVFDRNPPFVDLSNGVGFDAINANAIQRLITVQLTKNW